MTDRQDIANQQGQRVATARAQGQEVGLPMEQRLALLREALTNPAVDPAKASAMADLMFRMEDRDREAAFIRAKTLAISAMPRIGQDGYNTHLKARYSKWETIQPIVTRVLSQYGLSLSFEVGGDGRVITVRPILQGHGWTERGDAMHLPPDASGSGTGRNPLQATGSAVSYGKRYTASAMLNLLQAGVQEDDDGAQTGVEPYDQLTSEERNLVDDGRMVAADGATAYADWFKALPAGQKGFLAYAKASPTSTWHDQNKDLAGKV